MTLATCYQASLTASTTSEIARKRSERPGDVPHAPASHPPLCHLCCPDYVCWSTQASGMFFFKLNYKCLQHGKERKQLCIADAVGMNTVHYSGILSS